MRLSPPLHAGRGERASLARLSLPLMLLTFVLFSVFTFFDTLTFLGLCRTGVILDVAHVLVPVPVGARVLVMVYTAVLAGVVRVGDLVVPDDVVAVDRDAVLLRYVS